VIISGNRNGLPDDLVQEKTYKPEKVSNNIQVPGMVRKGNAGFPILSKENSGNGKIYKLQQDSRISMLPGDPQGSPDEFFSENVRIKSRDTLVFVDEAFLSKLSQHFGHGNYIKFDKKIFAINLARKEKLFCKNVFYYLAPPFQSEPPTKEEELKKEGHDKFVKKLRGEGVIVREGRCQRLKCNNNFVYKQKAVDVLLAMDLTNVPIKYPQVKNIILISSDSDFVPVVENLEENGIKTILYTYYEKARDTPFSRSNHLIKSVHKYVLLAKLDFDNAPLKKVKDEKKIK
jgi:uncharacterized LabA/DUF88 family protein